MRLFPFFLMLCLTCSVLSEELFVKNRPFQGVTSGTGQSMYVEASALTESLGLESRERNGGLLIGSGGEELAVDGRVVVNGRLVPHQSGEDEVLLIHLYKAAEALEAKIVHNKELDTIDLYLEAKGAMNDTELDDWDKGWQLDVSRSSIPEGPLRGKIGEARFDLIQATSFGNSLTLKGPRQTVKIILLKIGLVGGDVVSVSPDDRVHGNHIRVEWVDENGQTQSESYTVSYTHLTLPTIYSV